MKKKNNKKLMGILISIAVLMFLVFVFYMITGAITKYTGRTITGGTIKSDVIENFAKCLTEKGVKMYGAYWCGHCQNQKKMFGDNFKYVDYVECDPNGENSRTNLCLEKGIEGYPAWEVNGKFYPGEMSLEKLVELSGCKI